MIVSNIDKYIQHLGVSYNKFEDSLNVSRGSISGAIRNGRSIGSVVIEKIIQSYPDINPEWLLGGTGEMIKNFDKKLNEPEGLYIQRTDRIVDNQQIPLYSLEATAGLVELFEHYDEKSPIDYLMIPNLPKCDGAVFVTGDSMYPLLKSGDIVVYKQIYNISEDIFWGEMYLLAVDLGGEEFVTVKYIQKSDKGEEWVKLVSQNSHHQPKDIKLNRIRALAMIKASVRINGMK